MRKIVGIIILFVYVSLTALQVISIHFCHGHLESIAFSSPKDVCCSNEPGNHTSCCDDVVIEIDFNADHISSEVLGIDDPNISEIKILLVNDNSSFKSSNNNYFLNREDFYPPPKLYLLKQAYLFYG